MGFKPAPHQVRMLDEQKQLAERIAGLAAFLADPAKDGTVDATERERMRRQLVAMEQYDMVLLERIEAWGT